MHLNLASIRPEYLKENYAKELFENVWIDKIKQNIYIYIYIYVCVCVCVCVYLSICIYIYIYIYQQNKTIQKARVDKVK